MLTDFDYSAIFPDVPNIQETVSIVHSHQHNNNLVCVLGVLKTKEGLSIQKEMLQWLSKEFDVYCVCQKPPGILFEYPALRFAQYLSLQEKCLVLYLHTKGASQKSEIQSRVRALWKHEFTGSRFKKYLDADADVACPFLGPSNETWYNGMLISHNAFQMITINPSDNRYDFQRLFHNIINIKMYGILKQNIDSVSLNTYMMTMDLTFSGKRPDFTQALVWTPRLKKKKS